MNNLYSQLYYNHSLSSSLGGVKKMYRSLPLIHRNSQGKSNLKEWLSGEDTYTLHKPFRSKFPRQRTIVSGNHQQVQADLMDVSSLKQNNDGVTFLLTVIDVFSKVGFAFTLTSKRGFEVAEGLKTIFSSHHFRSLQTDKGKEFFNSHVHQFTKEHDISHFTSENSSIKASIVERFNKTLREKIYRNITKTGSSHFVSHLSDFVKSYNSSWHSSLGKSPESVNSSSNGEKTWIRLYENGSASPKVDKNIFQLGDSVRISKSRGVFDRGYTPNWSMEIFKIYKIKTMSLPTVYRLKDLNGEVIKGTFYTEEIQKVKDPEVFQIERIIKSRKQGKRHLIFVKWKGYSDAFNSWIEKKKII